MENQCLGLAEALGANAVIKRIKPRFPWRFLAPQLWFAPFRSLDPAGDQLAPPWPDLLIATGRPTVALSMAIRRASRGRTFTVQIQNPTVDLKQFDLVIAPAHDGLTGDNVISTTGALHRITAPRLAREADRFRTRLQYLPRPLVAVLIGGDNRQYRMNRDCVDRLSEGLVKLAVVHKAGLMVTPSRRTGAANEALIRKKLSGLPAEIWDGKGDNPYFAYLGLADIIVVTGDSVSMVSEACATGKPVYVFHLAGGSKKFRCFHAGLQARGVTRPFTGELSEWQYEPLDDMERIAEDIHRRMKETARLRGFKT